MANKKNQIAKPEATVSEGQDNAVSAKLRVLETRMNKLLKKLETLFGIDIDGDGKQGSARAVVLSFLCALSFAISALAVPQSTNTIWNLVDSTGTNDLIQVLKDGTLKVDGSVIAASTTLTGSSSPSATIGALTISTNLIFSSALGTAATNGPAGSFTIRINGTNYKANAYLN